MRHRHNLPCAHPQKQNKQIEIKSSVKRRGEDIIIPGPQFVMFAIRPIHDDVTTNDTGCRARSKVTPESAKGTIEDCAVPEVEFCFGECHVEEVKNWGCECAEKETVRKGSIQIAREQASGSLDMLIIVKRPSEKNLPQAHIGKQQSNYSPDLGQSTDV
jgi:hypothetical protein